MLAGMSVDYVVRLEQGRSSQPSAQLLVALARALRLSDDERDHLFHLAGHRPPPADGTARLARAGLVRMLDLLGDTPAAVLSDLGEMLAQNRASLLLMSDLTGFRGDRRYMIYRWFTEPEARAVCPPEYRELHGRRLVADLRAAAGRRAGDPEAAGLVERLEAASPEFKALWAEHGSRSGARTARRCCIPGSARCSWTARRWSPPTSGRNCWCSLRRTTRRVNGWSCCGCSAARSSRRGRRTATGGDAAQGRHAARRERRRGGLPDPWATRVPSGPVSPARGSACHPVA